MIYGLGVLLQGLATLGQVTLVPDLGVTQCEIKALITLLVYDDVLLRSKKTIGALGKRLKSKVKLNKDFCTTGKRPKINKDFLYKSKINKRPFLVRK